MNTYPEIFKQIQIIDKLGGPDSFFGYKEIFEIILKEEHERFGEVGEGMYRFKGMRQYGNILSMHPSFSAIFRCIDEYKFPLSRFNKLQEWYEGKKSIDCVTLVIFIDLALKDQSKTRPELEEYKKQIDLKK